MSFGVNRKGWTGGSGWIHSKGANSMGSAVVWPWLALGGGLFCPLWQAVSPCMASILSVQGLFFSYAMLEFPEIPD